MAPITVIDEMQLEWERLSRSPSAAAALERWKEEDPALARLGRLEDIVACVGEDDVDDVLAALVRRAAGEALAARAVLQLLLPMCRQFVEAHAEADCAGELALAAVSAAVDEVREWALAEGHLGVSPGAAKQFVFGWAALMAS